jgi:hypothetical protein
MDGEKECRTNLVNDHFERWGWISCTKKRNKEEEMKRNGWIGTRLERRRKRREEGNLEKMRIII